MKIAPGHFAKVMVDCKTETVMINALTFHNGKLAEIQCGALNKRWSKGFYPNQILEVIENPDAEIYIAELNKPSEHFRYIKQTTTIIPLDYEDGHLNNFE